MNSNIDHSSSSSSGLTAAASIYEAVAHHDHAAFMTCYENAILRAAAMKADRFHYNNNTSSNEKKNHYYSDDNVQMMMRLAAVNDEKKQAHDIHDDEKEQEQDASAAEDMQLHNVHMRMMDHHHAAGNDDDQEAVSSSLSSVQAHQLLSNQEIQRIVRQISNSTPPPDFSVTMTTMMNANTTTATDDDDGENDNEDPNHHHHVNHHHADLEEELQHNHTTNNNNNNNGGTLLHLSCRNDNAFALAVLLLFGADLTVRHTVFRRLCVHEACCWNSVACLAVLLEMEHLCGCLSSVRASYTGEGMAVNHHHHHHHHHHCKKMSFEGVMQILKETAQTLSSSCLEESCAEHAHQNHPNCKEDNLASTSTSTTAGIVVDMLRRIILGNKEEDTDAIHNSAYQSRNHHQQNSSSSSSSLSHPLCMVLPVAVWIAVPPLETQLLLQNLALQTDGHGNTPLHWSAFKNSVDCLALLLNSNVKGNVKGDANSKILKYHVHVNVRSSQSGWTPLHDAAYSNAAECIELLMQHGADVNACSNSGATPLCFAAQEDASRAVEALLRHGADARRNCSYDVIHAGLGHHHAPPRWHRFSGYTPLHYAAHYNAARSARALLHVLHHHDNNNNNNTTTTRDDFNPSSSSSNNDVMKVRKDLLSAMDVGRRMPIQIAAARGSSDVLRELLAAGAPLHASQYLTGNNPYYNHHPHHPAHPAAAEHDDVDDVFHDFVRRHDPQHLNANANANSNIHHHHHHHHHQRRSRSNHISLTAAIPRQPIRSSKPWNCLEQRHIDECFLLLQAAEAGWTPESHCIFTPRDRRCVDVIWMCGKFRAVQGQVRMCMDLWRLVLGFCSRGWFDPHHVMDDCDHDTNANMNMNPSVVLNAADVVGTVSSSSSSNYHHHHHHHHHHPVDNARAARGRFALFRLDEDTDDASSIIIAGDGDRDDDDHDHDHDHDHEEEEEEEETGVHVHGGLDEDDDDGLQPHPMELL